METMDKRDMMSAHDGHDSHPSHMLTPYINRGLGLMAWPVGDHIVSMFYEGNKLNVIMEEIQYMHDTKAHST